MTDLPPLYPLILDPNTVDRLRLRYGAEHAAEIVFGRDMATALDIQSWRQLGNKGARQWNSPNAR